MKLIGQITKQTKQKHPYILQVWQNHHGAFEAHIFMAVDNRIFSTYDRRTKSEAIRDALKRAEEAGY
jgi:hypothetical protein